VKSQGLVLYLGTIFLAAVAVIMFVAARRSATDAEQNFFLICFAIALFSLTMTIQAAIIRWGSRANDITEGLQRLESLLSVMIAGAGYNRCDSCGHVVDPTELSVLNIGKKVCENCKTKLET